MGALYKIDLPNGKSYIGIVVSTEPEARFKEHCHQNNQYLVGRAIRKYGKDSVIFSILLVSDNWEYLCYLERAAIISFNTKSPNGYNLTDGGEGAQGWKPRADTLQKMSESAKERNARPEHKAILSERAKRQHAEGKLGQATWTSESKESFKKKSVGKIMTADTCLKISIKNTGKKRALGFMIGEKNHRFGKKASAETRAKQSVSMKEFKRRKTCTHTTSGMSILHSREK